VRTYGLAYCVRTEPFDPEFRISATYCYSDGYAGFIAIPESWTFSWPLIDAHQFQRYGASQIQGLLGGVEDAWQMARSEAVERAVGDVLTMVVCEILDNREDDAAWSVYILGPALHKVIGRLASLRPPELVRIAWICPLPFPQWIVQGANEPVLLPSERMQTESLWEEEPLVITGEVPRTDKSMARCIRQTLHLWPTVTERSEADQAAPSSFALWGANLPKEIIVASGCVDNHIREPYMNRAQLVQHCTLTGEEWRCHDALYQDLSSPVRNDKAEIIGWDIRWAS
jgi:hypothetical protein